MYEYEYYYYDYANYFDEYDYDYLEVRTNHIFRKSSFYFVNMTMNGFLGISIRKQAEESSK